MLPRWPQTHMHRGSSNWTQWAMKREKKKKRKKEDMKLGGEQREGSEKS